MAVAAGGEQRRDVLVLKTSGTSAAIALIPVVLLAAGTS